MNFQTIRAAFARNLWRNLALIVVLLEVGAWMMTRQVRPVHADPNQRIWLGSSRAVPVRHQGDSKVTAAMKPGTATPVSLAAEDFDQDGVGDLVVGYSTPQGGRLAIHKGNLDAFAPQSQASFEAIGRGDFPEPYLQDANVIASPVTPDFLAVGRFKGLGSNDLLVAAKGGKSLYVMSGDGKGNFATSEKVSQTIDFDGPVTGLGVFTEGVYSRVLVGVHSVSGSEVVEYVGSSEGLSALRTVKMPADATSFDCGKLDGDDVMDAMVVAGSELYLLRGNASAVEEIAPGLRVTSAALGHFTFDRSGRQQILALGEDGNAHLLVHNKFDPTPYTADEVKARILARRSDSRSAARAFVAPVADEGPMSWRELETIPGAASGANPILLHTRISDNGADDAMVLSAGRMGLLSHPDAPLTGPGSTGPGLMISRTESIQDPVAAIAARVNVDGRPGVVYLSRGSLEPQVMMPLPDPTFTVNTPSDFVSSNSSACANAVAGQCSLREAIIEANKATGTDTIMVPAGTYTLTIAKVAGDYSSNNGGLYITDSVNIIGAGQNSTIIQGGTSLSTSVDKVLSVNEDINPLSAASASISNLTIQNGNNRGTLADGEGDNDGGGMEFDTGTAGTATLTLTNVTLNNNSTTDGRGGGIALFNSFPVTSGAGSTTFNNCIIQNNTINGLNGVAYEGGGIEATLSPGNPQFYSTFTMTNSQVKSNTATGTDFKGGGINIIGPGAGTPSAIHSSTISNNSSAAEGGGGIFSFGGFSVDQGTVISNNSTTGTGGGIDIGGNNTNTVTLSEVTITGNSATGNGGGIEVVGTDGAVTIQFSRIEGNTTSASGSNLDDTENTGSGGVNATEVWWGTNAPAATIHSNTSGCPATNNQLCFQPFLVLTLQATPQTIKVGGTSTLTASLDTDSAGNTVSSTNLVEIVGLSDNINNPVDGSIPTAEPENLNSTAQASATFDAGTVGGLGSAETEVDSGTAFANESLISSATESGNTVTITTVGVHGFSPGEFVTIAGVGVAGYNGQFFTIVSTPTNTTFTYTDSSPGLAASSGGTANAGIIILQPPSITTSFSPTTVAENTASTLTFSITNGNVVPINGSFSDGLPSGLVVATTPGVTNTCGGTVTATAASGTISFSNSALPKNTCTITVNVESAIDNTYNNSVTIDSSNAGNGNTASATLTVINPPHITKAFGAPTIVFGQATSLTFTLSSSNTNLALTGVAFTDTLPGTMVVATPSGLASTCTGSASGTAGSGTVALAGGSLAPGASCTVSVNVTASPGSFNNSVSVSSGNGGTGNTSSATLTVNKASTTTTVSSTVNPSVFGQSVTFTATITANAPGAGTPTGIVTFQDGGSTIGTGTLTGGVAIFTTSTLAVGSHSITTSYPGDTNFMASTGSLPTQTVNKAQTSTAVASSVNPSAFGQSVTFTATISVTSPGAGTPTGTVTFVVDGTSMAPVPLSGLTATFTTNSLSVGNHSIAATYNGDTNFAGSTGSLPTQTVNKSGTTTAVASSLNPSVFGQSVTFTATISVTSPGVGTPTGNVTFVVDGTSMTPVPLSGLTATFTTNSLSAGNHSIVANYNGDSNFAGSTGSLPTQTVNKAGTSTTLTSNHNPSPVGQAVTFTASIAATLPGAGTPTGTVTFLDGGTSIGTGPLTAGVATFTTSTLAVGNHTITTTYPGDGNFNGSSGSLNTNPEVIGAAPSIAKSFTPSSILQGGTSTLAITITNPSTTVAQTGVMFTDTLPSGMTVSSAATNTCGGTATASGGSVSLTGGTIAAGGNCAITVSVIGSSIGSLVNTTGNVSSTNGGTGNTATATLTVTSPDTAPTVTNLTSTVANGTYGVGAVIPIIVTFSKPVNVTGTPQIALNSGGTASFTSGSGTASLTFTYTVAAGQNSAALDATSTGALSLNGGTIADTLGTPANLTLPTPGAAGSLSANKNIVIDTVSPTVVSYSVLWGSESFNVIGTTRNRLPWEITGVQVVFSAPIASGDLNSLSGVTPTAFSGLGTNTLTWTITPISLGNFATTLAGSGVNALKDSAGNALAGGAGFNQNLKVLWGDFNDDGIVNSQDLELVNLARSAPYNIFADMNGDGVVNLTDVQIVHQRVGTSLP